MSRKLVVNDGTRDRELQLIGRLIVGRDPACDVSHDHALLSRRHAEFVTESDRVTVRDLGSRNGVFVNGVRTAERVLTPGDIVQIGPLRAKYVADAAAVSVMPEHMDSERTRVLRDLARPAIAAVVARPVESAPQPDDDEEVTRLVRGPRIPAPPARAVAAASSDDTDRTGFISAPSAAIRIAAAEAAAAVPVATAPVVHDLPAPSLAGFVFGQVLLLTVVVLAAAAVPWLIAGARGAESAAGAGPPSMIWLALPLGVGALAAWTVGAAINRRFARALTAVERKRIQGL